MNRLAQETSPYLLQHAHNPVDWYAWREEAFIRAREENKPILLSIGYSTCHWCHVMERESFEDEDIAAFMNTHFINIKVDREERPDIDQIYMEACQLISGSGGWPLNCFLLPDGRAFYAGTYYPPEPKYNRPSWIQVMQNLIGAYREKREVVEDQAARLLDVMQKGNTKLVDSLSAEPPAENPWTPDLSEQIYTKIRDRFDPIEGGLGSSPKFPEAATLRFLLHYHHYTKSTEALDHLELTLQKMINGGIYDQLGGGFARYATDRAWLIPHFEKMLYDNALLVELLAEAYQLNSKDRYRQTIEETLGFIEREMTTKDHLFYSALDADSEGVEGKFYVWQKTEIEEILGSSADLFCAFYGISEEGNWEHQNILWRAHELDDFSKNNDITTEALGKNLEDSRQKLLIARSERIRPGLDDKSLLNWNALMISAYAKASAALGKSEYQHIAVTTLEHLLERFSKEETIHLYRTYKNGRNQYDAFLEDYAYLIKALLDVYSLTFDWKWIEKAESYLSLIHQDFWDEEDDLYYFTAIQQQDIVTRRKDLYDNATPSGNALVANSLRRLGMILEKEAYKNQAERMWRAMRRGMETYPSSFSAWATGALHQIYGGFEIVVIGENAAKVSAEINRILLPGSVVLSSEVEQSEHPLFAGRYVAGETLIYVCQDYTCQSPVKTIEAFKQLVI